MLFRPMRGAPVRHRACRSDVPLKTCVVPPGRPPSQLPDRPNTSCRVARCCWGCPSGGHPWG
eukprot:930342-Alexandrium_andersonii.AAC.1